MKKRIFTLALALALCLSLIPAALATENGPITDDGGNTYTVTGSDYYIGAIEGFDYDFYTVDYGAVVTPSFASEGYSVNVWSYYSGDWIAVEDVYTGGYKMTTEMFVMFYKWNADNTMQYKTCFRVQESTIPASEYPSDWARADIGYATRIGLVPYSLQKNYTQATTRAEFCALAVALYENIKGEEITDRLTFTDTTDVNVEKMAAIDVVNGVGDGKFSPDAALTREQAATMLARLIDAVGKDPILTNEAAEFADNDKISSWAAEAVALMQVTGIMGGVGNNTFDPAGEYTREQSIVTMYRTFNNINPQLG